MATKTGSSVTFDLSTQNPAAQSITVPADAQLLLFEWCGFADGLNLSGAPTLNGVALTLGVSVAGSSSSGASGTGSAWLVNPATGSQSLDWAWAAAPVEGPHVVVSFWKDVDTANPVRDSDVVAWLGTATQSVTLTTNTGDTVVGLVQSYNTAPNAAPASSGQTVLDVVNHIFNSEHVTLAQEDTAGAATTVFSGTGDYGTICAVAIRTAAAAPASSLPPGVRSQARQALRHF